MGVDQTSVLLRLVILNVFLSKLGSSMKVPVWKLNWFPLKSARSCQTFFLFVKSVFCISYYSVAYIALAAFTTYQVLVSKVERFGGILLDAPVQRLDARVTDALVIGIVGQLETGAAEAVLGLEDGLLGNGDLERPKVGAGVEARVGHVGEEQDLGPRNGARPHKVWVEEARGRRVKVAQLGRRRHLSGEHDGAADGGPSVRRRRRRKGRQRGGHRSQEAAQDDLRKHGLKVSE